MTTNNPSPPLRGEAQTARLEDALSQLDDAIHAGKDERIASLTASVLRLREALKKIEFVCRDGERTHFSSCNEAETIARSALAGEP